MAKVCSNCKYAYNPDNVSECIVCNRLLMPNQLPVLPTSSVAVSGGTVSPPVPPSVGPGQRGCSHVITGSTVANSSVTTGTRPAREASNVLMGRITHLERNEERLPGDVYRVLSRIMIGILIAIPCAFIFIVQGILSLSFGILGFHSVSQLFNPIIWTSSIFRVIEVLMLRNLRGSDTLPVYRGTIEDSTGTEQHFMMNGPLVGGNLIIGSRVSMTGDWRNGTLHAKQGEDTSAGTAIRTDYRNPWRVMFFILVSIYSAMGICAWYFLQVLPA